MSVEQMAYYTKIWSHLWLACILKNFCINEKKYTTMYLLTFPGGKFTVKGRLL